MRMIVLDLESVKDILVFLDLSLNLRVPSYLSRIAAH